MRAVQLAANSPLGAPCSRTLRAHLSRGFFFISNANQCEVFIITFSSSSRRLRSPAAMLTAMAIPSPTLSSIFETDNSIDPPLCRCRGREPGDIITIRHHYGSSVAIAALHPSSVLTFEQRLTQRTPRYVLGKPYQYNTTVWHGDNYQQEQFVLNEGAAARFRPSATPLPGNHGQTTGKLLLPVLQFIAPVPTSIYS